MTDDLPTPPLPEAMVITRVVGATDVCSTRWLMLKRARSMAVVFSSAVISVQSSSTLSTPGSEPTRARMSRWSCARSGHPAVVRATVTVTVAPSIAASLTMPSSTMSEPSSGSITPRSAPITSSIRGSWRRGHSDDSTGGGRAISGCSLATVTADAPRLDLLKALGDNTRYAIYLELARSTQPLATADIAESLGLHVNTVRPHLERMRDVGLLEVQSDNRGAVGRPQHRYLARRRCALARARAADVPHPGPDAAAGRRPGRHGRRRTRPTPAASRVERTACRSSGARVSKRSSASSTASASIPRSPATTKPRPIAFAHCPFRELAEANPDLVCSLHRGLVEGFVDVVGAGEVEVVDFHTLVDRTPCQVELVGGSSG